MPLAPVAPDVEEASLAIQADGPAPVDDCCAVSNAESPFNPTLAVVAVTAGVHRAVHGQFRAIPQLELHAVRRQVKRNARGHGEAGAGGVPLPTVVAHPANRTANAPAMPKNFLFMVKLL